MTAMPRATGLFETHLTVSDLDRSIEFYRDVVGLPLALVLEERGAAFFWIGGPGEAMLGLWSLGSAPMGLSLHVALKVSLGDVLAACDGLRSNGVTPLSFFGVETSEPSVIGWMPAAAVYFRDPDGHLIEYLAMLEESARAERRGTRCSRWRRLLPIWATCASTSSPASGCARWSAMPSPRSWATRLGWSWTGSGCGIVSGST